MKIEVITHWYNEEKLSQLFFSHYDFVDKIHVFLDLESSEESKETLYNYELRNSKIIVRPFGPTNGMDDELKMNRINKLVDELHCDWIINVDFDEFIFALPPGETVRNFLSNVDEESQVVFAQLWQVYRNINDKDLDYNNLSISDRKYGDPDIYEFSNRTYIKPIVVRQSAHVKWKCGNHNIWNHASYKFQRDRLYGSHWANADPELAVERRYYGRALRQSRNNLFKSMSVHFHKLTIDEILSRCNAHLNDPKLFDLSHTETHVDDKVSICIPYIRPEGFERCVQAIRENAGIPESQYEIIADEDVERIGATKKFKQLVDRSNYDIVMFLGDDTVPQKDFLKKALETREKLPDKWGLVGLNDSFCDYRYNATHWMADKKLLPYLDGDFFHTGYRHCFADHELTERCIAMGRYIFSFSARIEHVHPIVKNDRSLMDKDYKWIYSSENKMRDHFLFTQRKKNNWKTERE